jgi:eukaryotic-like serine/threonine-protein kinase
MELWNDYEGKTVATFQLKKLLRPEGRSAFFTTSEAEGKPAVLRLTESVNDQDELLERWRQVAVATQPNLIKIKRFGSVAYDGVPLTYALLEAPDASLAEILAERPLTSAETLEVATAVTSALRTLHDISFIHEHIEPASVYAVGETIKLRSDCVRESIPDPEFNPEELCRERRLRDIHDLGALLLRCLTLEKSLTPGTRLPAPFDQVIPHALNGSWTLAQIADALNPPPVKPLVPAEVLAAAKTEAALEPVAVDESPAIFLADDDLPAQQELPLRSYEEPELYPTHQFPVWARNPRIWIATAVALLILFVVAHIHSAPAEPAPIQSVATAPSPTPATVATSAAAPETQPGWRVIVYTYTKEAQAFAKAAAIQANHPDLQAQVFAQHKHAPFLVSLGGPMSHAEADAMLHRARRAGLPRDAFVRLYNS